MNDAKPEYQYLLGDAPGERERLERQSRLWDPVSLSLFDRLGVGPGWRVLEVGPGAGSLHRALTDRVQGPVDAVERSPVFARTLGSKGTVWEMDLIDAPLPEASYDLIFARWVFLFLPDPARHVRHLVRALKPGGLLALQDYHRATLDMSPRRADWANFVEADRTFFATQGGDASIGTTLPRLFRDAGLQLVETTPHLKVGHPGSAVWAWLSDYFLGVMDRYAVLPGFDAAAAERLRAQWRAAAVDPSALLIGPAVLDVVGRRP